MKFLKNAAALWCLLALAYSLTAVAAHVVGWTKGIDSLIAKSQEAATSVVNAADTANDVSTEMLDLTGSLNKLVDHFQDNSDRLNRTIDNVTELTNKLTAAVNDADKLIVAGTDTVTSFKSSSIEITQEVTGLLLDGQKTLRSGTYTLDSASTFLNGPLTDNSHSVDRVLNPTGLMISDFQKKEHQWLYPDHKQSKLLRTFYFIRSLTQPAYYGVKLTQGQ